MGAFNMLAGNASGGWIGHSAAAVIGAGWASGCGRGVSGSGSAAGATSANRTWECDRGVGVSGDGCDGSTGSGNGGCGGWAGSGRGAGCAGGGSSGATLRRALLLGRL